MTFLFILATLFVLSFVAVFAVAMWLAKWTVGPGFRRR